MKIIEREETFQVKDEIISATVRVKVDENDEKLYDPILEQESDLVFFKKYREIKNLLQPDEIKSIRDFYGFTQRTLAVILGWGDKTLTRYENGSVQDESHNRFLKLIRSPSALNNIFLENRHKIKEKITHDEYLFISHRLYHLSRLEVHPKVCFTESDLDFEITNTENIYTLCDYIINFFNPSKNTKVNGFVTQLKLQKLLYFLQSTCLAFKGKPLFNNRIEAWANGPVIPEVWQHYTSYSYYEITKPENDNIILNNKKIESFLDKIISFYGKNSAEFLVELTHKEDPWIFARRGYPDNSSCNVEITTKNMEAFFKELYHIN